MQRLRRILTLCRSGAIRISAGQRSSCLALVLLGATSLAPSSDAQDASSSRLASAPLRLPNLTARLTCDRTSIKISEALPCHVYFIVDRNSTGIIFPRVVMPYLVKGRPPTLITFHLIGENGDVPLEPSYSATHGRYHPPAGIQEEGLQYLWPGDVFGWTYDLNGDDWVLPKTPGTFRLSATVKIDLAERDPNGKVYEGVAKLAGVFIDQLKDAVASGEWTTDPVTIVLLSDDRPVTR